MSTQRRDRSTDQRAGIAMLTGAVIVFLIVGFVVVTAITTSAWIRTHLYTIPIGLFVFSCLVGLGVYALALRAEKKQERRGPPVHGERIQRQHPGGETVEHAQERAQGEKEEILSETSSGNSGERDQAAAPPADKHPTTPAGPTGVSSYVGSTGAAPTEDPKAKYGFWIVIAGLGSVIVLYIGTIITFATLSTADTLANNVVAAMGAITGVIGSLVGAYFGVQVGASGKEASDARATQQSALAAQQSTIANAALAKLPPEQSQDAIDNAQRFYQATS